MTVQTSYSVNKVAGYVGDLVDARDDVIETKLAAAAVSFGLGVVRRASPADGVEQCAHPNATADVTARPQGIVVRDQTRKNTTGYETNDAVRVLRRGKIWVQVENAVTADAAAFCRFASGGGGSVLGSFRSDADTATAVAFPTAVFRTSTSGAGLAQIEINLP